MVKHVSEMSTDPCGSHQIFSMHSYNVDDLFARVACLLVMAMLIAV
jgi:hypothetical protein